MTGSRVSTWVRVSVSSYSKAHRASRDGIDLMGDEYFIKPGYVPNPGRQRAGSADSPFFWTARRVEDALRYQSYVYKRAAELARTRNLGSVLDVGCGPAVKLRRFLPSNLEVCLVDQPSVEDLALEAMPASAFVGADLETITLELRRQYDLIICADVLEHLSNPDPCLRFLIRHLARTGVAVLSTPDRDVLRGRDCLTSPHPDHVREWNSTEFRRYVEDRGLRVLEQRLYPQKAVNPVQHLIGRVRLLLGAPPSWLCCQTVTCVLGD